MFIKWMFHLCRYTMSSRDVEREHGENHHPGWWCNYCHMHNYYYDIVCMQNYDIIHLVRFCEVIYINLCIGHAKIFINLPTGDHEKYFRFFCLSCRFTAQTDRLPVLTERFTDPNRLHWHYGLVFWICSVFTGYRGLLTGLPKPVAGGSMDRFGNENPAPTKHNHPGRSMPSTTSQLGMATDKIHMDSTFIYPLPHAGLHVYAHACSLQQARSHTRTAIMDSSCPRALSGIHPGYSYKERWRQTPKRISL
jgi:hypothetical protein